MPRPRRLASALAPLVARLVAAVQPVRGFVAAAAAVIVARDFDYIAAVRTEIHLGASAAVHSCHQNRGCRDQRTGWNRPLDCIDSGYSYHILLHKDCWRDLPSQRIGWTRLLDCIDFGIDFGIDFHSDDRRAIRSRR